MAITELDYNNTLQWWWVAWWCRLPATCPYQFSVQCYDNDQLDATSDKETRPFIQVPPPAPFVLINISYI